VQMKRLSTATIALIACAVTVVPSEAQGVGEIVRIPAPITPHCINGKTEDVTISLRRVVVQKDRGFLTDDKEIGASVIATFNAAGKPDAAVHPKVSLLPVRDAAPGQVGIALEYPVVSQFPLLDSDGSLTKDIRLDIYLDKLRGKNTLGTVLDAAQTILKDVQLPANPYTNAAGKVFQFAGAAIASESKDKGGEQIAQVAMGFANYNEPNLDKCFADGHEQTGVIAVIGPKGGTITPPISPLKNLEQRFCWRFVPGNTYEVQYADKPAGGGCDKVPVASFQEVPNDYLMILVSTVPAQVPPPAMGVLGELPIGRAERPRRLEALIEAAKLCEAMKVPPSLCGVR
jgi:hypothetical protein